LSVTSIFKKKLKITKFETFQTCDAGASKNGPRERETNTKGYCIVAFFREAMRTLGLEEKSAKLNKKETLGRSTPGLAPVESTAVENLSIQLRGYTKYIYMGNQKIRFVIYCTPDYERYNKLRTPYQRNL
jgi:hypothetical protein